MLATIIYNAALYALLFMTVWPLARYIIASIYGTVRPLLSPIIKLATSGLIGFTIALVVLVVGGVIIYRTFTKHLSLTSNSELEHHLVMDLMTNRH